MKKRLYVVLSMLGLALTLIPSTAWAIGPDEINDPFESVETEGIKESTDTESGLKSELYEKNLEPAVFSNPDRSNPLESNNIHRQNYTRASSPVYSYLFSDENDGLYRVEYSQNYDYESKRYISSLVMEQYDKNDVFLRGWNIPVELPIFGGFYNGSDGYYFVFGQTNDQEDDSTEVVRVVKYSRDLKRLGEASLNGANTTIPFRSSSLRMDESNGLLYIRTGHQMYTSDDNLRHQANMTLAINTESLSIQYKAYSVSNISTGYVSHSFNQFIKIDQDSNDMITVDHGDAYPRSIVLCRTPATLDGRSSSVDLLKFGGSIGDNTTGAAVGGLEISKSHYLTVGNTVDQKNYKSNRTYNIFLAATDKNDLSVVNYKQLTNYTEGGTVSASTPQLVKISDDLFAVLWEECQIQRNSYSDSYSYRGTDGTVQVAFLDGQGNQLGNISSVPGALSDCHPIVINGVIHWYVTDQGIPAFYQIDCNHRDEVRALISSESPKTVVIQDVQGVLNDCESVYAASYNNSGKMTDLTQGVLKNGKIVFNQEISNNWKLFFLSKDNAPIYQSITVSDS